LNSADGFAALLGWGMEVLEGIVDLGIDRSWANRVLARYSSDVKCESSRKTSQVS